MKISSISVLGEKSHGLLQNSAVLPQDLVLLAQASELLGGILMQTASKSAFRSRIVTG